MNIVIIDDQPNHIDLIAESIKELNISELEVIGKFNYLNEAAEFILNNSIDLIFLDISFENEESNVNEAGFLFLKRFKKIDFSVVFVTGNGNEENKVKAAKLAACDFIEKPTSRHLIAAAIIKMLLRKQNEKELFPQNNAILYETMLHNMVNITTKKQRISITVRKDENGNDLESEVIIPIKISDIVFIKTTSVSNKFRTEILLNTNISHITTKTIADYKKILDTDCFINNGSSIYINMEYILKCDSDHITLNISEDNVCKKIAKATNFDLAKFKTFSNS